MNFLRVLASFGFEEAIFNSKFQSLECSNVRRFNHAGI
jgi:hypothetical protein